MKAHKYWTLGALAAMIGTFYTGYKNMKTAHKYFACSSLLCMIMACKLRSNGMPVPLLRNGYSIFNGTKYR